MFPRSFYVDASLILPEKTATVTGVLPNPMDLVTSDRAWLTIKPGIIETTPEKKTLIFCDHLFNERTDPSRKMINVKLYDLLKEGFNILVLNQQNELKEWDGNDIPEDYSLPLNVYTKEFINSLARKMMQLTTGKIFQLDYFGLNEAQGKDRGTINLDGFSDPSPNLLNLIESSQLNSYALELNTDYAIEKLYPLGPEKFSVFGAKVKSFTLHPTTTYTLTLFEKYLLELTEKMPNIEQLFISKYYLHDFRNKSFKSLKKIVLDQLDIKNEPLRLLLKSSDKLQNITLHKMNKKGLFEQDFLSDEQLQKITTLDFSNSNFSPTDLKYIFTHMTNMEDLNINGLQSDPTQNAIEQLAKDSLPNLKRLKFSDSVLISHSSVTQIFRAAKNLERIELSGKIVNTFKNPYKQPFQALKSLHISGGICGFDLLTIMTNAAKLEELAVTKILILYSLTLNFTKLKFMNLKSINFSGTQVDELTLNNLILASPNLQILILNDSPIDILEFNEPLPINITHFECSRPLYYNNLKPDAINKVLFSGKIETLIITECNSISGAFEKINTELSQLKKLHLSLCSLSKKDFNIIFCKTPLLEELVVDNCLGLQDFDFSSKPHLKIAIFSGTQINLDDVKIVLDCCPNLTIFNLNNCNNIPKEIQILTVKELRQLDFNNEILKMYAGYIPKLQSDQSETLLSSDEKAHTHNTFEGVGNSQNSHQSLSQNSGYNQDTVADDNYFKTTLNKNKTLSFTKYFKGIDITRYRIAAAQPDLQSLKYMGKTLPDIFIRTKLADKKTLKDKDYTFEEGSKTVTPHDGRIIMLPSIEATEKLFELKVINEKGEAITLNEDAIRYSKNSRFYQIVLPKAGNYTINFKLALKNDKPNLPFELTQIINKYNSFRIAEKDSPEKVKSLQESVDYIKKNECGSCRLRVLAAYADLKESYKDKVQIIYNDVHAFVEVNDGDKSYTLDLGGYPANLMENIPVVNKEIIKESAKEQKPESKEKPKEEKPKVTESELNDPIKKIEAQKIESKKLKNLEIKAKEIKAKEIKDSVDKKPEPKIKSQEKPEETKQEKAEEKLQNTSTTLAICPDDASFQQYLTTLSKESTTADTILVLHRPEDINISSMGITPEGQILKEYTALNRWLQNRTEGSLIVDIRNFSAQEIAQLNDLLDGRVEEKTIPAGISIIMLDKPDRRSYGPDFRRRVPKQLILPVVDKPLLNTPAQKDLTNAIVIDLYDSPFWKNMLAGFWELVDKNSNKELSFQWKKEQLLHLALNSENKDKKIVLKNPPLNDPTFKDFIVELQSLKRINWANQITTLPEGMNFYQNSGYDWAELAKSASLEPLTGVEVTPPYILSDSNILFFVHDVAYEFSTENQLETKPSYLERAKESGTISIFIAPGTSAGTVANLLNAAKQKNIAVKFLVPSIDKIPKNSPLNNLNLAIDPEIKLKPMKTPLTWELHEDVYLATQMYRTSHANVTTFDLSSLESSELSRVVKSAANLRDYFLATGKFKLEAPLSAILTKLKNGETIILTGDVPNSLYVPLAALASGQIEGERFSGKLVLLTPPKNAAIATALTGLSLEPIPASRIMKENALNDLYPGHATQNFLQNHSDGTSFAVLEREFLQTQLANHHIVLTSQKLLPLNDEARANEFDQSRVNDINNALKISSWVMVEGPTGIGKSTFLHGDIPGNHVTFNLAEWLTSKPSAGKNLTLVIDEANFISQLSGLGDHFVERFQGLNDTPPGFYYNGVHHQLTSNHKVIFAFNKATYGAGRTSEGFLSEHGLYVTFLKLPDFYLRARMIKPMLNNLFGTMDSVTLQQIANPIINVYNWILTKNPDDSLITPREIKAMVNLVATELAAKSAIDSLSIYKLSAEIAYQIGKQTLSDNEDLTKEFQRNFEPVEGVLNRRILPEKYMPAQQTEYEIIQTILQARNTILNTNNPDLGLGGILLEGNSGIGKTHFIHQIKTDFENQTGEKTYRISPSTPYYEKEAILLEAFKKGAVVIAEEFNTSLWPNKLLNNLLMGLDQEGHPSTRPGFLLLATQNPSSFEGRTEEDLALRRRFVKFELDWPVYAAKKLLTQNVDSAEILTPAKITQPSLPQFFKEDNQSVLLMRSIKTMIKMIKQMEVNYKKFESGRKKNETKLKTLLAHADQISVVLNTIADNPESKKNPATNLSQLQEISATTIKLLESSFKNEVEEWLNPKFLALQKRTLDGFIDRMNNQEGHHFKRMEANLLKRYYEGNPHYPADPKIRSLVTKIHVNDRYTFSKLQEPVDLLTNKKSFKLK